jgi:glycosyltransferase involved in cell wall biosynthesis
VREAIMALGKDHGVEFMKNLSRADMLRELSEAACFPFSFEALAGPCETFSVSVAESMAIGVPVAMRFGDALESLWGRSVHRIEHVASDVARVLTDRELAHWLSDTGRRRAHEFTFENKAKTLDAAIRENLPSLASAAPEPKRHPFTWTGPGYAMP